MDYTKKVSPTELPEGVLVGMAHSIVGAAITGALQQETIGGNNNKEEEEGKVHQQQHAKGPNVSQNEKHYINEDIEKEKAAQKIQLAYRNHQDVSREKERKRKIQEANKQKNEDSQKPKPDTELRDTPSTEEKKTEQPSVYSTETVGLLEDNALQGKEIIRTESTGKELQNPPLILFRDPDQGSWFEAMATSIAKIFKTEMFWGSGIFASLAKDARSVFHNIQRDFHLEEVAANTTPSHSWYVPINILLDASSMAPQTLGFLKHVIRILQKSREEELQSLEAKVVAMSLVIVAHYHKQDVSETARVFCEKLKIMSTFPRKNALKNAFAAIDISKNRLISWPQLLKFTSSHESAEGLVGVASPLLNHPHKQRFASLVDFSQHTANLTSSDLQEKTENSFHELVIQAAEAHIQSAFTKAFAAAKRNATASGSDLKIALQQLKLTSTMATVPQSSSRPSFSTVEAYRRNSSPAPISRSTPAPDNVPSFAESLLAMAEHDQSSFFGPSTSPCSQYTLFCFALIFIMVHEEVFQPLLPHIYLKFRAGLSSMTLQSPPEASALRNTLKITFECFGDLIFSDHFYAQLEAEETKSASPHWIFVPAALVPLATYFASEKYIVPKVAEATEAYNGALQLLLSSCRVYLASRMNVATLVLSPAGMVPRRRYDAQEAYHGVSNAIGRVNGSQDPWQATAANNACVRAGQSPVTWGMLINIVSERQRDQLQELKEGVKAPAPPIAQPNRTNSSRFVRSSVQRQ